MIISSYLGREILRAQGVIAIILLLVFVSQSAIRLISTAASGQLPVNLIGTLTLYALPGILSIMLPLTLFIAILLTYSRICSDSEMVVMHAVGYAPLRLLGIACILGLLTAALCGACSLYLAPYAASARAALLEKARSSPVYLPFESGRFVSFGPYNIYAERIGGAPPAGGDSPESTHYEQSLHNIYVMTQAQAAAEHTITIAREGFIETDVQGIQWLRLAAGRRYEGPLSQDRGFRVVSFDSFRAPVAVTDHARQRENDVAAQSFAELLEADNPAARIEAQWRVAPLLASFILSLTAVPLAMVNPRQGRFAHLLPALLLYAVYYMLLLAIRNMVNTGRFPLLPGLYAVPVLYALAVTLPLNLPRTALRAVLRRG